MRTGGRAAPHRARRYLPALAAAFLIASPARSQALGSSAAAPQTARLSAMGGAGVAALDEVDARAINPALLAFAGRLAASVGLFRVAVVDIVGAGAGLAVPVGVMGAVGLDAGYRQLEDLIEDPELAAEPGLGVSDWSVRLAYAKGFLSDRLSLGAAVRHSSSTVLGTEGDGWDASVGAAARLSRTLAAGAAVTGLGPSYRWSTAAGERNRTPLGRALLAGARWTPAEHRHPAVTLLADVQLPLEEAADRALRAGAEVRVARVLALRAGYEAFRAAGTPWTRAPGAGIGIHFQRLRIDLARDRIGEPVGERTVVGVAIGGRGSDDGSRAVRQAASRR